MTAQSPDKTRTHRWALCPKCYRERPLRKLTLMSHRRYVAYPAPINGMPGEMIPCDGSGITLDPLQER